MKRSKEALFWVTPTACTPSLLLSSRRSAKQYLHINLVLSQLDGIKTILD